MANPSPQRKKVVVLGSTGSIGTSTLKVAQDLPDRMEIVGIAAHRSTDALVAQLGETGASYACIADATKEPEVRAQLPDGVTLFAGEEGLVELIEASGADMAIIAIVGTGGLRPTLKAIELGMDLAIASKEILVMAGETVMNAAREAGINVLPVDSEHNAIFQCLAGAKPDSVNRLILTASGGPFRKLHARELIAVTPERALKHPTWEMGKKITIDSASLFNKGLEMIEARWLFDIEMSRVDVIVHPQSIVHSMVEFVDSSILAQLSTTDMCFPIQYAVTYPDRLPNSLPPLDFAQLAQLDFEAPRYDDFPALNLAREVGDKGGTLPAVMNAANEIAVEAFLAGNCTFPAIWESVGEVMTRHGLVEKPSLDTILEADQWARTEAKGVLGSSSTSN